MIDPAHDDPDDASADVSAIAAVPSAFIRLVVAALGCVRPLVVLVVLAVAVAGCGRKGGLEVPGTADGFTGTQAQLAASRGLEPRARLGNTVVADPTEAPPLRGTPTQSGGEGAELRAADIRGANADAPEAGDAVPEGPTVGTPPRRRFLLDPLL